MSIFHILTFIYITILMVFGLLVIFISSWELIIFNILRCILKIIFPGRPILCRIGTLFFNKKKIKISMDRKGRTIGFVIRGLIIRSRHTFIIRQHNDLSF